MGEKSSSVSRNRLPRRIAAGVLIASLSLLGGCKGGGDSQKNPSHPSSEVAQGNGSKVFTTLVKDLPAGKTGFDITGEYTGNGKLGLSVTVCQLEEDQVQGFNIETFDATNCHIAEDVKVMKAGKLAWDAFSNDSFVRPTFVSTSAEQHNLVIVATGPEGTTFDVRS